MVEATAPRSRLWPTCCWPPFAVGPRHSLVDAVSDGAAMARLGLRRSVRPLGARDPLQRPRPLRRGVRRRPQASRPGAVAYVSAWALSELIEASVRSGNTAVGVAALADLAEAAAAADTAWARGVEARSRALLSDSDVAESHYRAALEQLGRTQMRPELARAHLLYGEWLRRQGRRVDAVSNCAPRTTVRRHRHGGIRGTRPPGSLATGEKVRTRTSEATASHELTPQEKQVAVLARDGLSNPRSVPASSSALGRWSGICARSSESCRSAHADSCVRRYQNPLGRRAEHQSLGPTLEGVVAKSRPGRFGRR